EKLYTLDYYLQLAGEMVNAGAHVLAIKDMAGLLRPGAATPLGTPLPKNFALPGPVHTHDPSGGHLATPMGGSEAGVDGVGTAAASSYPRRLRGTPRYADGSLRSWR